MKTRACLLTGRGEAAIGMIEVFGLDAEDAVGRLCGRAPDRRPRLAEMPGVDEVVIRRIERGFTGAPTVEICCHGGPSTCEAVLSHLRDCGVERVDPVERARIAVECGVIDAVQAEAFLALPKCSTRFAARILNGQAGGTLSEAARICRDPQSLMKTWPLGRALLHPPLIVLAGPPNAGKSTLLNALLERDRAIVSDVPGTTRDPVSGLASFNGIPVRIEDTAGVREGTEAVEAEAIRRTRSRIEEADLVVCLGGEEEVPEAKRLRVHNKADLGPLPEPAISALKRIGLEKIVGGALARLGIVPAEGPVVFTQRQARWVSRLPDPQALRELLHGKIE